MVSPTVGAAGLAVQVATCAVPRRHDATTPRIASAAANAVPRATWRRSVVRRAFIVSGGGHARRRRGAAARRTARWSGARRGPHPLGRAAGGAPGSDARPRLSLSGASVHGSYHTEPALRFR